MDQDDLRPIFEDTYSKFTRFKAEERYYLIITNLYEPPLGDIYYRSRPIPQILSEIGVRPASAMPRSTTYIRTAINIAAKEKEHLEFIPFDENEKKVYYSTDLEVYKSNPFNQHHHDDQFILNKQLYQYIIISILKIFVMSEDWMRASTMLADQLGKSRRLMMHIFNETINNLTADKNGDDHLLNYKNYYCQICLRYSCCTHFFEENFETEEVGIDPDIKIKEQYKENVMDILDPGNWKVSWWSNLKNVEKAGRFFQNYKCVDKSQCCHNTIIYKTQMFPYQIGLIKKFLKKGLNNPCAISLFIMTPCKTTAAYLSSFDSKYVKPLPIVKIPRKIFYSGTFDYKPILVNVIETHCKCTSECSIRNKCPCLVGEISGSTVIARRCCEKYCLCNLDCRQRFLGCNCQIGRCDSKNCICYVNLRECDPELCFSCQSCLSTKKNFKPKKKSRFLCLNMRNQLRIIKKTACGFSVIPGAGMGLFLLENSDKGEYITEYTGELIGEAESERRAAVYDYKHHSFIFSLSPDLRWAIDSTYYGSKMRYVNHKSHNEHNAYAQVWSVKGQVKILLFTAEKIAMGQELFFDYGYDTKEIKYHWLQDYEKRFSNKKK